MFNLGQNPKVRGSGHLILNALRAFNIIALAAMMVSSWAMIVISGMTGHFSFFDTASHFFVFLFAVFLTITELNLFKGYFNNNWPVFTIEHSLAWLGVFMIMLGCQVLGNLDKDKYSQENLSLAIWRLVLASGILAIAFGFFNIIASIIFRDGSQGITARHIRKDGSLATADNKASMYDHSVRDDAYQHTPASYHQEKEELSRFRRATRLMNPMNMNLPKNFNFRRSRMEPQSEKRIISSPILHDRDVERGSHDGYPGNDRVSPMTGVQAPDAAHHPAFARSSRYSVASLDRFTDVPGRDRAYDKNYL
ncbi:hypothetical protein GE09DRAFT_278277 [Coniochaeta sp. 2T2.1]|nr:hypothetical protein GE09DRAFT_278277 [Coniochaeta sp. 2T2.1]